MFVTLNSFINLEFFTALKLPMRLIQMIFKMVRQLLIYDSAKLIKSKKLTDL